MSKGASFFGRACLALALMAGFYVLTILLALFLLILPMALTDELDSPRRVMLLYFACWPSGGLILWSLRPRFNKFSPPGPLLTETQSPRLFAMIQRVANATKQPMPKEVYLSHDFNASVMKRGDVVGIGGKRVLIIGLPLMDVLNEPELESVLVHEFGHYSGGDTALGSVVYTTHIAIERTINDLDGRLLQIAYALVGNLCLRLTQAVSRQQEFAADRMAAEICGAQMYASALMKIVRYNLIFGIYMECEFLPFVRRNLIPQFLNGFNIVQSSPWAQETLSQPIKDFLSELPETNSYGSHPALRQRLEAICADISAIQSDDSAPRALALLDDIDALENRLMNIGLEPSKANVERIPIKWEDVFAKCVEPEWRAGLLPFASEFEALTIRDIGALVADKERLKTLFKEKLPTIDETAWESAVARLLGSAVLCAVVTRGGVGSALPGHPVKATFNDKTIVPIKLLAELLEGSAAVAQWDALCNECGIGDIPLKDAVTENGMSP